MFDPTAGSHSLPKTTLQCIQELQSDTEIIDCTLGVESCGLQAK